MLRSARFPLVLIAAACLAAACGGSNGFTTATRPVVTAPAPAASTPSGTVVRIRDGEFLPGHLVVIVGHPVQWQNFDTAGRRVQAVKGASFSSGVIATGKVFSWTPHRLGKVRYRDPAHPGVVGTIVVVS